MAEETAEAATEATTEPAKAESGTTFTQDQVNALIAKEKGKFQQKYGDYGDLKAKAQKLDEIEAANASELEKAQKVAEKAQTEAASAATKLLRFEVAQEKEVPAKLVPLLTATSKEELEAQADLLLENVKPETPSFDGGSREPVEEPLTPEQEHNKLFLQALGITRD